jgi:hypothetical protein
MTAQNPFENILTLAYTEDSRQDTESDYREQNNPFKLNLISACISENIKAVVKMVKGAIKQPFQLLADVFFPTMAILEGLRLQPALVKASGTNLRNLAQKTSFGLPSPYHS